MVLEYGDRKFRILWEADLREKPLSETKLGWFGKVGHGQFLK